MRFRLVFIGALFALLSSFAWSQNCTTIPTIVVDPAHVVTVTGPDTATVTWQTPGCASSSEVTLGPYDTDNMTNTLKGGGTVSVRQDWTTGVTTHTVNLTNLHTATKYWFNIVSSGFTSGTPDVIDKSATWPVPSFGVNYTPTACGSNTGNTFQTCNPTVTANTLNITVQNFIPYRDGVHPGFTITPGTGFVLQTKNYLQAIPTTGYSTTTAGTYTFTSTSQILSTYAVTTPTATGNVSTYDNTGGHSRVVWNPNNNPKKVSGYGNFQFVFAANTPTADPDCTAAGGVDLGSGLGCRYPIKMTVTPTNCGSYACSVIGEGFSSGSRTFYVIVAPMTFAYGTPSGFPQECTGAPDGTCIPCKSEAYKTLQQTGNTGVCQYHNQGAADDGGYYSWEGQMTNWGGFDGNVTPIYDSQNEGTYFYGGAFAEHEIGQYVGSSAPWDSYELSRLHNQIDHVAYPLAYEPTPVGTYTQTAYQDNTNSVCEGTVNGPGHTMECYTATVTLGTSDLSSIATGLAAGKSYFGSYPGWNALYDGTKAIPLINHIVSVNAAAHQITFEGRVANNYGVPNTSWQASHVYAVGALVWDGANVQKVTAITGNNTSGATTPSWNATLGGTTTDGHVTWTNQGPLQYIIYRELNALPVDSLTGSGGTVITCASCDFSNLTGSKLYAYKVTSSANNRSTAIQAGAKVASVDPVAHTITLMPNGTSSTAAINTLAAGDQFMVRKWVGPQMIIYNWPEGPADDCQRNGNYVSCDATIRLADLPSNVGNVTPDWMREMALALNGCRLSIHVWDQIGNNQNTAMGSYLNPSALYDCPNGTYQHYLLDAETTMADLAVNNGFGHGTAVESFMEGIEARSLIYWHQDPLVNPPTGLDYNATKARVHYWVKAMFDDLWTSYSLPMNSTSTNAYYHEFPYIRDWYWAGLPSSGSGAATLNLSDVSLGGDPYDGRTLGTTPVLAQQSEQGWLWPVPAWLGKETGNATIPGTSTTYWQAYADMFRYGVPYSESDWPYHGKTLGQQYNWAMDGTVWIGVPAIGYYLAAIATDGSGTGSLSGANCYSSMFAPNTSVTCIATPDQGSTFAGFTGTGGASACSSSPCTFNLSANATLTATFNLTNSQTGTSIMNAVLNGIRLGN